MLTDGKALIDQYLYLIRLTESGNGLMYSSNWRMILWHDIYCHVTKIPVGSVTNQLHSYMATKGKVAVNLHDVTLYPYE